MTRDTTPSPEAGVIPEDEFHEQWGAHVQSDGNLFEFADVREKPLNLVWTIVDTDEGHWIAIPGFHIVNRLGYCMTTKPWTGQGQEAYWFFDDLDREENVA